MLDRDVVFGKIGIIQRCLLRIRRTTDLQPEKLEDLNTQDVFVLNVQRAVQAALDLAAHIVAEEGLGMPKDLKEHFQLLMEGGILSKDLSLKMERMVGFRNIAVHEYQTIDIVVLKKILVENLKDLEEFYSAVIHFFQLDS